MKINAYFRNFLLLLNCVFFIPVVYADDQPWRLDTTFMTPEWFSIGGTFRTRFENLDEQYRGTRNGGDQVLLTRTLIQADLDFQKIRFSAELEDSRAYYADDGTPLSGSVVNPLELLQAYVEIPFKDLFTDGSESILRGGRLTMDVGSRRFVARNRFRNTINAFTGIDWQWKDPKGKNFRAFFTLPVQRRVSGDFLDNDARFDREHEDVKFWGIYYARANLLWDLNAEFYFFGLNEEDVEGWATRDRNIYTPGIRIYKKPANKQFSYEIESVLQFGETRSSTSDNDLTDLDHFAYFQHAEIGYQFDIPWSPQLFIQYDYASGDQDNMDSDNERFDTLFGARRFDFGPTSIYGPFARSNLSSPGIRLKIKPGRQTSAFLALRGFWLASDDDAWTTAGISNPAGVTDNYIGTQIEGRIRQKLVSDNILLEAGAAHLIAGDIMDNAGKESSTYVYTQLVLSF